MAAISDLERYRTISTLGVGGMATVVLAQDNLLGRQVALKRVATDGDVRALSRFRREALVGASVSHRNVVAVYDVITTDGGEAVIVMEYVPGETLRERLDREGRLTPREALPILAGVAEGLDAIHSRGIVHRDIKPANILLGPEGAVKLADLGIAAAADRTQITTAGTLLGSFRYMAPEQMEGGAATPAIDVYGLAAVAFETLSGRSARDEPNPMALAHAISTQPPPNLRDAWPTAPQAAADLLSRAMSRDAAIRPRSATELIARLRAALDPQPTLSAAPAQPSVGAVTSDEAPSPAPFVSPPKPRPQPASMRPRSVTRQPADRAPVSPMQTGPRIAPRTTDPSPAGRGRAVLPILLMLVVAGAAIALALNVGGSRSPARGGVASHHRSRPAKQGPASSDPGSSNPGSGSTAAGNSTAATSGSSESSPPATLAPGASSTPVSAVESFYHLAASHNYAAAWALADPAFRSQLAGYSSFQAGQSADESITFRQARVTTQSGSGATVAISTTSVRTDGTTQCGGTVNLVHHGSGWLLHRIHINCA